MTFNPNIPQANDDPTASQSDLLGNFGKLNSDWAVNHVPLTSGGNNGLHKLVQFPNVLGSDPSVTGLQSAVYPKLGADSNPALFFENILKVYQLTNLPVTITGNNYGIVTPFGFIINMGLITTPTTSATFAIPFVSKVYSTVITQTGIPLASAYISAISLTAFTIIPSVASSYYYLAIGV